MTTTTDLRVPAPSFETTLETIMELVRESPTCRFSGRYLDEDGLPFDLLGHVVSRLDAPLSAFHGHRDHHIIAKAKAGIPGSAWNEVIFPLVWGRLFVGDPLFLAKQNDRDVAEDYLVFALLSHIQRGHDSAQSMGQWKLSVSRGLRSFRSFLNSPYSGFLVQTHGHHEDLLEQANTLTRLALKELS